MFYHLIENIHLSDAAREIKEPFKTPLSPAIKHFLHAKIHLPFLSHDKIKPLCGLLECNSKPLHHQGCRNL